MSGEDLSHSHMWVQQCSILGPLLYILYTNDLPEAVHEQHLHEDTEQDPQDLHYYNMQCKQCGGLCLYADDSTFTLSNKNATKRTRQHARIVFHRRSSSIERCLPPQFVFHRRSSSTEGRLPPMVVFHWRSYSTKGRLPPPITPLFILYLLEQSTYQISVSYLQ